MYVYRKGVNGYAMYLEIEQGVTVVEHINPEKWRESASIQNDHLITDDYISYLTTDGRPTYQKTVPCPVAYPCANKSCDSIVLTYGECCTKVCEDIVSRNTPEHTGSSVNYYDVIIPANSHTNPAHNEPKGITVSCNDIIEALNMNYACANVFKAIWRICAAKNGMEKKGNNTKYDAEKAVFFSKRVLTQESK